MSSSGSGTNRKYSAMEVIGDILMFLVFAYVLLIVINEQKFITSKFLGDSEFSISVLGNTILMAWISFGAICFIFLVPNQNIGSSIFWLIGILILLFYSLMVTVDSMREWIADINIVNNLSNSAAAGTLVIFVARLFAKPFLHPFFLVFLLLFIIGSVGLAVYNIVM
jgi:hypothetical protein